MKKKRSALFVAVVSIALGISVIVIVGGFVNYHQSNASVEPVTLVEIEEKSQDPVIQEPQELVEEQKPTQKQELQEDIKEKNPPVPVVIEEEEPSTIHTISKERQKVLAPDDPKKVEHDVPFTTQAPGAQWDNPVFQDGCEEASIIMGMMWVNGEKKISKDEARKQITDLASHATEMFGESLDLSTQDTTFLIRDYYDYEHVYYFEEVDANDIIDALYRGSTVILAVNGKKLHNPNFKGGGPDNHMLIVSGYDPKKEQFITNDPGTRKGEGYRYSKKVIDEALRDYPTGFHEPNTITEKMMIELWK